MKKKKKKLKGEKLCLERKLRLDISSQSPSSSDSVIPTSAGVYNCLLVAYEIPCGF